MSRRDYVAIAAKLRHSLGFADGEMSECEREAARRAVACAAFGIADALAADNVRFDRVRFLAACGVTS